MEVSSGNIDQRLIAAYLKAIYEIPAFDISIQIGKENIHLSELLIDNNIYSWAFIAAVNPKSKKLSSAENALRHQEFIHLLEKEHILYKEGLGKDPDGIWETEQSLFILGISKERALEFGKQFEQHAIVYGELHGLPQLLFCAY